MTTETTPTPPAEIATIFDKKIAAAEQEKQRFEKLRKDLIAAEELAIKQGYTGFKAMYDALTNEQTVVIKGQVAKAKKAIAAAKPARAKKKTGNATPEEIKAIVALLQDKKTIHETARISGRSVGLVNRIKREHKLTTPRK